MYANPAPFSKSVEFDLERIMSANLELQYSRTVQKQHGKAFEAVSQE